MGLFGRKHDDDPAPNAAAPATTATVTARGTIERVLFTGQSRDVGRRRDIVEYLVALAFRFGDPEQVVAREMWIGNIYRPGAAVDVTYDPADPAGTIDYDRHSVAPPDRSKPRGWSAGEFSVDPLGIEFPPNPGLDAERELFRTGRQAIATVVHQKIHVFGAEHGSMKADLVLDVDGQQIEVPVMSLSGFVPNEGERMHVAVADDGRALALDTDERYCGPPGRLLVSFPPDASAAEAAHVAGVQTMVDAKLAELQAQYQRGQITQQAFETTKASIEGAMAGAVAPQVRAAQIAGLEQMRDAGRITPEQFEAQKAKLLGG